jgi:hypothetical protein
MASSHTVCQMPLVRGYQMACGSSSQSCFPRGFARSAGSSAARTTTSHFAGAFTYCETLTKKGV